MLLPEKTSIDQPDRAQYNKIILPQSSLFCIRIATAFFILLSSLHASEE